MKRNRTLPLALVTFAALTFASNAAWANHHWGNNNGMGNQGYSQLTQEQQATVQKLHNDYYAQTSALRQQLQSKRYEYNALLTAQKPDSEKIEAVAQEMEGLRQKALNCCWSPMKTSAPGSRRKKASNLYQWFMPI